MSRWYLSNNYEYGPITAEVTDGQSVSVSDVAYSQGKWSLLVSGLDTGKGKITVTATTADSTAVRKYSFIVEVQDKAKLRTGLDNQYRDYR